MPGTSLIFFFVFALVLVGMYILLRRGIGRPALIAGVGTAASIIAMVLTMLSNPAVYPAQGIIFGVLIGALFGGAVLAVAWFFGGKEMHANARDYPVDEIEYQGEQA